MRLSVPSLALLSVITQALAAPAPVAVAGRGIEEHQLLSNLLPGVSSLLGNLLDDVNEAVAEGNPTEVLNILEQLQPTTRPTNIEAAVARQAEIWASPTTRNDFFAAVATQIAGGLVLDETLKQAFNGGLPIGENSINNNNPPPPSRIYPKKDEADAPYTLSESALRKVIFIPSGFTYGAKRPVIFVPGTASYGGLNFASNLRKLLTGKSFADPVWLNIPGAMLGDAQTNSEYIAYAINYISAISGQNKENIAVISWSQGGLDTQWVLKYWPSTRKVIKDFLAVSADFKGTVLANALCLTPDSDLAVLPCDPSVIQQEATSDFIRSLRRNGGDSAYVPTTTFFSGFFDEVVQPQSGTAASGFINDARNVGVSNNEVQVVCAGQLGGTFYDHAGVLFNPLTYALVVDALQNEGPGDVRRIDLNTVCDSYAADGLDLDDVLATSGLIPVAGATLLTFPQKSFAEPPLRAYAR
ncbi:lipase b precursor [Stemphylium lycopersici]|uniref:Lipase b n=1 Tax=Stemphylium lycopersici TaxID=183478 RepID=A0A364N781_STELY|nr:lipase b precursor [Stemphylium lycopersici]RAR13112.1 lipase b precursor [Stemphylium lycopersici]